jgi:alanine-glyoxylate transaminase/serine-glyoxylate transaminase/serine-pyruvate transaminase
VFVKTFSEGGTCLVQLCLRVLVISHGKFGESLADFLSNQGANVTIVAAAMPGTFPLAEMRSVDIARFKAAALVHVDTSTAVLAPVREVAEFLRGGNPDILICVDSVAGLGGELLRTTDWDLDFVITASQKVLSAPPGLSISIARPRALAAAIARKRPVRFNYVSWAKWGPVMQSYMEGKTAYFATPAIGLVSALNVALGHLLANGGLEQRVREHSQVAVAFR